MTREWSEYQQAVFEFVQRGTGHGVVLARAGSGKTTTIVEACKRAPLAARVLFVAFNKSIADELSARVPGNTTASTLHSFGFRAIKAAWGARTKVDKDREKKLAQGILPRDAGHQTVNALCKLVSMAKAWLVDDAQGLTELAESYQCTAGGDISAEQWARYAQHILRESRKRGDVSFDDMVWLPVVERMNVDAYDMVFVDETQDLNRAQVELVVAAAGRAGRIVAVGDDRQAIYAFRGADSASIERLTERLKATVMPLSITYRCPVAVVELARQFVSDLTPANDAAPGNVVPGVGCERMMGAIGAGDFVLSRTNAPLARLCLEALRDLKPAFSRGRDIGQGLAAMVRKSGVRTATEFAAWLDNHTRAEAARLVAANKSDKIDELNDRAETLHVLSEGCTTTAEIIARIAELFDDANPAGRVMFSSTHRAKGLEADRVWMLENTYKPKRGREEENLYYVAVTRARKELNLVVGVK
jgi:DNA helicase-2/ATP-dependent DNA helicase PcrA